MIHHRAEEDVRELFELGFGKRPREELYDLRIDPHYMNNVADNPEYEPIRKELSDQLMEVLREQDDPRPAALNTRPTPAPSKTNW
jgi:N-sulfoglucosamine sulfohydrolase